MSIKNPIDINIESRMKDNFKLSPKKCWTDNENDVNANSITIDDRTKKLEEMVHLLQAELESLILKLNEKNSEIVSLAE